MIEILALLYLMEMDHDMDQEVARNEELTREAEFYARMFSEYEHMVEKNYAYLDNIEMQERGDW